jgi:hypothetical protein
MHDANLKAINKLVGLFQLETADKVRMNHFLCIASNMKKRIGKCKGNDLCEKAVNRTVETNLKLSAQYKKRFGI